MKYIASCSFGKDSLAMILTIIKHGLPLDEVVYCEVMFDENISGEYPAHADFIHNKAIPVLEVCYGLKVRVLRAETTYKQEFYRLRTKGRNVGTLTGFPTLWSPWCNGYLKRKPIKAYHKEQADTLHEYVGIAADEPERLERLLQKPNTSAPLADFGITEATALEMCRDAGLLSPIYENQSRNGCWFCHNARIGEMRQLFVEHPELWAELHQLQTDAWNSFTKRNSVFDLEERFKKELQL